MDGLGLAPHMSQVANRLQILTPTPIQQSAIPVVLSGRDVLGAAPTGTGKTAAYALPILDILSRDPYGVFALVLLPSRELAMQVADQWHAFGSSCAAKSILVIGGVDMTTQGQAMSRRPHIVIATLGRLAAHFVQTDATAPYFQYLKFLVLDDVDRLLEDSMREDLLTILSNIPGADQGRRTLAFSATMTEDCERTLSQLLKLDSAPKERQLVKVDVGANQTIGKSLLQLYVFVPRRLRLTYLYHLLSEELDGQRGLVFVATVEDAQFITNTFEDLGISAAGLHSIMDQKRRNASIGKFRADKAQVLVTTDVASRGLDLPKVDFVVNYSMPKLPVDYIQRVGRTARAGLKGRAISFVTEVDAPRVLRIEEAVKTKLEKLEFDEVKACRKLSKVSKAHKKAELACHDTGFLEKLRIFRERKGRARQNRVTPSTQ
eukprot:Polyplicarium_translucidae@DN2543_c0_g1_i1.p1